MKSLCIKTNNSKLLQYLLNELKHFELSSICFSLRKFKHYNNIIIHYNGVDNSTFLNKISYILTIMIIDELEETFLKDFLNQNYFYFDFNEKNEILELFFDISAEDFTNLFEKKFNIIYHKIYEYLSCNKSLFLSGFIYFRLQDYFKLLDNLLSRAVNSFVVEKEYMEFISLLKLYVTSQPPTCSSVHIIYSSSECLLLDEYKQIIDIYNYKLDAKYLSDISFSTNDYTLNTLLNILPEKIYIHVVDSYFDEFLNTLRQIFEDRIIICADCNICKPYKNQTGTTTKKV